MEIHVLKQAGVGGQTKPMPTTGDDNQDNWAGVGVQHVQGSSQRASRHG